MEMDLLGDEGGQNGQEKEGAETGEQPHCKGWHRALRWTCFGPRMKDTPRFDACLVPPKREGLMATRLGTRRVTPLLIQGRLSCEKLGTSVFIQELFSGARYLAGGPAKNPSSNPATRKKRRSTRASRTVFPIRTGVFCCACDRSHAHSLRLLLITDHRFGRRRRRRRHRPRSPGSPP
jgi:hypothetical protein